MGTMIDYDKLVGDAFRNSNVIDMPVFHRHMAERAPVYTGAASVTEPTYSASEGFVDNGTGFSLGDRQGGYGGDMRSAVPMQDLARASAPQDDGLSVDGGTDAQTNAVDDSGKREAIEAQSNSGDINTLLSVLQALASMSPSEGGDPVFNLDSVYKGSSPLSGIQGTSAGYPSAGLRTRETEY